MEVYLIRHTSVDVPAGFAYGQTDVPLNATFTEEAARVKEELDTLTFDKVWTSPLSRCVMLADFCGYPDAERDNRLKELNFGTWEMKSWQEISTDPRSEHWFNDWIHFTCPEGESFMDQYNRVSCFLDEVRNAGYERIAIFAHGGVLTAAQIYNQIYPIKEAFNHIPPYGSVIKLEM